MRAIALVAIPTLALLIHHWVNVNRTDKRLIVGSFAQLVLALAQLVVIVNTVYLVWRMQ